ncbi:MAG TPA: PadR family transcriptional regulator [Terriglobales bacterium]|nr:PadR family transcriptional regulator [Terriglobales bacterium]
MTKPKFSIRRSPQTIALLDALLENPSQWRYGYDLSRDTGLASGTLYPILMRLSERGVLEARWEEVHELGRPPRHVYRLTAAGRERARELLASERPVNRRRSRKLRAVWERS